MIYPLTKGLLISMAFRYDHGFGIDRYELDDPILSSIGYTEEMRNDLLEKMKEFYFAFQDGWLPTENDITGRQLFEEVSGKGFYHPDKETIYNHTVKT